MFKDILDQDGRWHYLSTKMSVLLAALLTVMWVTPALGAAPTITGPFTATISDTAGSVMVPGYTVADADGDAITYALSGTIPAGLTIDGSTGAITTSAVETGGTYTLSVTTAADTTPVTQDITYTVFTDSNAPVISGTLTATLAENVAVGTEVGTSITVTDSDGDDGAFFTISGIGSSDFEIGLFDGTLKVKQALDFETKSSYTLDLSVKDSKQTEDTATITLTITDVNDAPVCSPASYTKTLAENAAVNDAVVTVACSDVDAGASLTYALVAGNTDTDFAIDSSSGAVTVAKLLDFETKPSYTVNAEVTDGTSTATATIAITITEDKITAPLTSKIATLVNSVAIPAYTVTADAGSTYAITPTVTGLTIDTSTGVVSADAALTAGPLDYVVVITTGGVEVAKETITNTVFTDTADPVISTSSVLTASVAKGVAVGTTIPITITVTDADNDDGFTYEISGTGSDKFVMDYFTSVMKTAAALDSSKYTLDLVVKDSKRASATGTLTITVTSGGNDIAHTPAFYVHLALGLVAINYLFQ
ncbi:hypothetical protein ScPMuIL_014569 [Solemya velum]